MVGRGWKQVVLADDAALGRRVVVVIVPVAAVVVPVFVVVGELFRFHFTDEDLKPKSQTQSTSDANPFQTH